MLGVTESLTTTYLSVRWATAVPTLLVLVVLTIRPRGLFTRMTRQDAGS